MSRSLNTKPAGGFSQSPVDPDESIVLFVTGRGLEEVVAHLGVSEVATQEHWTSALVGRGMVLITSAGHVDGSGHATYECIFQNGEVDDLVRFQVTDDLREAWSATSPSGRFAKTLPDVAAIKAAVDEREKRGPIEPVDQPPGSPWLH